MITGWREDSPPPHDLLHLLHGDHLCLQCTGHGLIKHDFCSFMSGTLHGRPPCLGLRLMPRERYCTPGPHAAEHFVQDVHCISLQSTGLGVGALVGRGVGLGVGGNVGFGVGLGVGAGVGHFCSLHVRSPDAGQALPPLAAFFSTITLSTYAYQSTREA